MTRWGRARNALRGALAALALLLGWAFVARWTGVNTVPLVWLVVPASGAVGGAWPLPRARFLLRAGRRLGVGERLAALDVLVRRGTTALSAALADEVRASRPRGWRVLAGPVELGLLAVAVGLALGLALPRPLPAGPGAVDSAEGPAAPQALAPAPPAEEPPRRESAVPGTFPGAESAAYSPYADLLAAVLGLDLGGTGEGGPEDLPAWLAREQGLLRTLAERLRAAAPGGLSPAERDELLPLAGEVARADLRVRLEELVRRGDTDAAAQAVEAVLEAAERAREGEAPAAEEPAASGSAPGAGPGTPVEGVAADWDLPLSDAFVDEPEDDREGDPAATRRDREVDAPGTQAGEPLEAGPPGDWGARFAGQERVSAPVGEGPVRAYLVPSVPGEPPSAAERARAAPSPQEVELVLRARGVPPELRDLVRRYFELIGGNP